MRKELLIFGSSGALGRGVIKTLKSKDYEQIYLFDFHPNEEESGCEIEQIKVEDLSNEENVKKAFTNVKPSRGTSYFLFSTVGGFEGGKTTWETEVTELDKMININLKTSFLLGKHFSKLVTDSHSGSICFTAAFVGLNAEPNKSAYGASKAALIHLIETLALEGKDIKLSVNAIAPFIIDTPANRKWMKDADYESWIKPSEVGELVHLIFSNYNFITGNIIKLKDRFL